MFSILLSVFTFGHHLSIGQWASVCLVFVAIIWESVGKDTKKEHKHEKLNAEESKESKDAVFEDKKHI